MLKMKGWIWLRMFLESGTLRVLLIAGTFSLTSSGYPDDGRTRFYDHFNNLSEPSYDKGMLPTLVYRFLEQSMSRGCTVSIKCIATGNPTPTIKWLMDGFKAPPSERFMIGQYVTLNGDVISHFNVSSCSSEDSAEISCTAKNELGAVSHKARLNIFGPPFVRDFVGVQTAVSGKDFMIKCPVGGYPIDHINWFREQKQLPLTSRQATSLDGTLTIKNVQKADKGNYTCTAKYKDLSHSNTLQINVVVPPKLSYFRPETVVEAGERVVKYCEAGGDTPIELEWLHNGMTLDPQDPSSHPDIQIQHIGVDIALVLIITQVTSHFSHANFTCVARNEVGEDRLTTKLIVQVSPIVTKLQFPEALEGMRVSVHCAVSNYAQDVIFVWLKDGLIISGGGQGTRILQLDPFSSILSIENVSLVNVGNYSCVVSNAHGNSSHTAELTVFVPPKWTTEPVDIEGIEGERIMIPCEAEAYPPATISWKKGVSGRTGSYVDIPRHGGGGQVPLTPTPIILPNGTLLIPSASAILGEGKLVRFVCEAENGIGSGISKLIHLRINVPVKIQQPSGKNVTLRSGNTGTLKCVVSGDFPIHLNWFHGQEEVIPIINHRYQIKSVNTSNGISSELTLSDVRREDALRPFLCTAKNLCSTICRIEQQEMWLIVLDPPGTPLNLTVVNRESRFVELSWKLRRGKAGDDSTRISIKYKMDGGPWNTMSVTGDRREVDDLDLMSTVVSDLRPATNYIFIVMALNVIGTSESKEVMVKTNEEPPDQTLRNLVVTALSPTQVKVQWDPLAWSNGEIGGYTIGIRKILDGGSFKFTMLETPLTEIILHKLLPFTRYEVVAGAFNAMGQGPLSKSFQVMTLESVPLPPKGLSCYTLTSQKLQVSWNGMTPEESRGILRGYRVYIQRAHIDFLLRDELIVINTTASETSALVDNLSKYTMYEIQILSYTSKGEGELSSSVYCQTEEDIPSAPEELKLIRIDAIKAILTWSPPPPAEVNGEVTHYTVYFQNEPGRTVPPNITQIEVKPPRFQAFLAHVSAATKMGEGGNATISFHQDRIGSGLISFGRIINIPYKTNLTLSCLTAVGKPLRTWFFQSKIIQENERKYTESQGSILRIKSLQEDDGGNYSCFQPGFTWEGITFKPERISYKLIVQVPPPPPKLREHESSFQTVSLRWSVKDNGRGTTVVEGFLLHIKVMDEWLERKLPRRLSTHILHDLNCGTTYPIYLTAYNKAGMSRPSQLLNVTTKGGRPTMAVSPESLVEVNNTWILLSLRQAFNDGGCPIVAYRVLYRKTFNELHWKSVDETLSNGKKRLNLTGLEENTNYLIKIWAENEAGRMEITFSVKTLGITAEQSNNLMKSVSDSLYLNAKVFGPILLASILVLILISAIFLVCKKRTYRGEGEEPTGDAFTYFKQNVQNSQSQQNQVYMTVKKSAAAKTGSNDFDLIPHSPEGVNPYATFELKNSGTGHRPRRKRGGGPRPLPSTEPNPFYISKDPHICNSKLPPHHHRFTNSTQDASEEEEEEYESIPSDSDSFKGPRRTLVYEHRHNGGCGGGRYANRYEPALKSNNHNPYVHETEMYLEDVKPCKAKNKRGGGSFQNEVCRKDGSRNPGAMVLCEEPPPPFGEEDLHQIKV